MHTRNSPDQNPQLKNRCYHIEITGQIIYMDDDRGSWGMISFENSARSLAILKALSKQYEEKYGLHTPDIEHFHLSFLRGDRDEERVWAQKKPLEGDWVQVWIADSVESKGEFTWVNAYCEKTSLLRRALLGDEWDQEAWGHITIGRTLDYNKVLEYHSEEKLSNHNEKRVGRKW